MPTQSKLPAECSALGAGRLVARSKINKKATKAGFQAAPERLGRLRRAREEMLELLNGDHVKIAKVVKVAAEMAVVVDVC